MTPIPAKMLADALWRAMDDRTRVPLAPGLVPVVAWIGDGGELHPIDRSNGDISATLDQVASILEAAE